jgi:hypothetical protein
MIVAAATLAVGYFTKTEWVIYLSIVCSLIAVAALLLGSRRRREPAKKGGADAAWTSSLAEPAVSVAGPAVVARGGRPRRERDAFARPDPVDEDDDFGEMDDEDEEAVTVVPSGRAAIRRRTVGPRPEPVAVSGTRSRGPSPRAGRDFEDDEVSDDETPDGAGVGIAAGTAGSAGPSSRPAKRNPVVSEWIEEPEPARASAPARAGAGTGRSAGAASARSAVVAPGRAGGAAGAGASRSAGAAPSRSAGGAAPARSGAGTGAAPVRSGAGTGAARSAGEAARPAAGRGAPTRVARPAPPVAEEPFPIEDYDELDAEDILPLLPHLYDEELVEVFLRERDGAHRKVILERLDALLEGEG